MILIVGILKTLEIDTTCNKSEKLKGNYNCSFLCNIHWPYLLHRSGIKINLLYFLHLINRKSLMIRVHIPVCVLVSFWALLPKLKTICHKYNNGF